MCTITLRIVSICVNEKRFIYITLITNNDAINCIGLKLNIVFASNLNLFPLNFFCNINSEICFFNCTCTR